MPRTDNYKKQMAQDAILTVVKNAAVIADEHGFTDVAKYIRKEATRLAKRYGVEVPK